MLLIRGRRGFAAALCRVAAFVFGVTWIAFDSVAGVATGIFAPGRSGQRITRGVARAGDEHLGSPDRRRGRDAGFGAAAAGGRRVPGMGIGSLAAVYTLRGAGSSWIPVGLLVISSVSFAVFKTHAPPGGPIAFGTLAAAAAWIRCQTLPSSARFS
jgi:hypothetical protein